MNPDTILGEAAAGSISPEIALARLLLGGALPDLDALRARAPAVAALAERHAARLPALQALAASDLSPGGADVTAATARLFDRLAAQAPEAGVAFYSFGDPDALAAATAELAAVVRDWSPPAGRRVLDFGCGIGRLALALADEAAEVLALDVSAGMIAEARRRAGDRPRLRLAVADGRTLAPAGDETVDLLVAADSLPYVLRAGGLDAFLAEAARVLAPGGDLLVFNWSYRGDPDADLAEVRGATRFGLRARQLGARPFRIWDATGFHLRREP